jgi:hypothetical protein
VGWANTVGWAEQADQGEKERRKRGEKKRKKWAGLEGERKMKRKFFLQAQTSFE